MAAIRSMWTGAIRLGLLNVPITVGKSWSEERERGLRDICADHKVPIDRSERCGAGHDDCSMTKVKGVEASEGKWREFSPNEYAAIEEATKSDTLDILDAQPIGDLPVNFSTGTYYLRADKKAKGSELVFATLVLALAESGFGLVAKWCRSTRQQLVVIDAAEGILRLRTIPYESEVRAPGDEEKRHFSEDVDEAQVAMLVQLLTMTRSEGGFSYAEFSDDGLKLRQDAVQKVLDGEISEKDEKPEPKKAPANDLMALMQASIDAAKSQEKV